MKHLALTLGLLCAPFYADAQNPTQRPPVGVPSDALQFNGKWYRIYHERLPWNSAKQRCTTLGGQLAIVPDEPTWVFLRARTQGVILWLGATDEEVEGVFKWIDGTPFTFKAWLPGQPDNAYGGQEHFLHTAGNGWNDVRKSGVINDRSHVVGFICEWKSR